MSEVLPKAAGSEAVLVKDNLRPFSMKHNLQQALIVGNMERFGLLEVSLQAMVQRLSISG